MTPVDLRGSITVVLTRARRAVPAAALASGLLTPVALGASGDLDPAFGDVGRAYPLLDHVGNASAIKGQGDGRYIVAGGRYCDSYSQCDYYYYYYGKSAAGFASRMSAGGAIDEAFAALSFGGTQVRDLAVAADGSLIGIGRTLQRSVGTPERTVLTVFRLGSNGVPDAAFGENGIVHLFTDVADSVGNSVLLEPDGRIVVAGVRAGELVVLRLLADGTTDAAFAESGIFVGPENVNYILPKIVRAAGGGYRVTNQAGDCAVLALTADGAVDGAFGALGQMVIEPQSICGDLAVQDDGRLLVAGGRGTEEGFVVRLLPGGDRDGSFDASAITGAMVQATAIEPAEGGKILVAGRATASDFSGALVMRLLADGQVDASFGASGSTVIDLPTESETWPTIHDMLVTGGKVLVSGSDGSWWSERPFVAQLMADAAAGGPGVTGIAPADSQVEQQDGSTVVTVRRTGGRTGAISVVLRSRPGSAAAGDDYASIERTLTWEDGDAADQQVEVSILADLPDAVAEEHESFELVLSDVQGGAGFGTKVARITIAPDGAPAGQFSIFHGGPDTAPEPGGVASVTIGRNYYDQGAVSVTVTPVSGTATAGGDFAADAVTLTWADGETSYKQAQFAVLNDNVAEELERFSVQLSAPTGGAVIGPYSSVSFTIPRNDQPAPSSGGGGGGGAVGFMSLLLFALATFTRRCWRWAARWPESQWGPVRPGASCSARTRG